MIIITLKEQMSKMMKKDNIFFSQIFNKYQNEFGERIILLQKSY